MRQWTQAMLAAAGVCLGASSEAGTVAFRIVEREGQIGVTVSPVGTTPTTDPVLNFAVQARIVPGSGGGASDFISGFGFKIVAVGEPDANGTLAKLLISNTNGTYTANAAQTTSSVVGRGGLSAIYTHLALINPAFNGVINSSAGTFSNTPGAQEIGLIEGSAVGDSLLQLTDLNLDGHPDTYSGSGTTAPISGTVASTYLGAGGNWVDVYRFKYSLSNLSIRTVQFSLMNVSAQTASSLVLFNGVWGPAGSATMPTTTTGAAVDVGQAAGACCTGSGCVFTLPGLCGPQFGGEFQGIGVICGTQANPIACCRCNFNQIGGINVSDIFDFLGAWFQSSPATDFDESGSIGVGDIFFFLNGWFSGC